MTPGKHGVEHCAETSSAVQPDFLSSQLETSQLSCPEHGPRMRMSQCQSGGQNYPLVIADIAMENGH